MRETPPKKRESLKNSKIEDCLLKGWDGNRKFGKIFKLKLLSDCKFWVLH